MKKFMTLVLGCSLAVGCTLVLIAVLSSCNNSLPPEYFFTEDEPATPQEDFFGWSLLVKADTTDKRFLFITKN